MLKVGSLIAIASVIMCQTASASVSYCIIGGGVATYHANGRYTYINTYGWERPFEGTWQGVPGKSVTIYNKRGKVVRRDTFVIRNGHLYLANKNGFQWDTRRC
jgi:hypothetical protein